jgi:hypothetical protein
VSRLIETLAAELERPRELSARVLNYISGTYEIDGAAIGAFLVEKLREMEDYEIDLILSPVFTPKLTDQAIFAELLGGDTVPRDQWPGLIRELAARPTRAQLVTAEGRPHPVPLKEVTLERYVHRLRLEGTIPEPLLKLIDHISPAADRPIVKAVARRAIWDNGPRADVLANYLTNATGRTLYSLGDTLQLLDMVESYKPADIPGLLAQIPPRQEILRRQINSGSGGKPFFSQQVQDMHGGDRDQRRGDDSAQLVKENELAFLERLLQVFRPY